MVFAARDFSASRGASDKRLLIAAVVNASCEQEIKAARQLIVPGRTPG